MFLLTPGIETYAAYALCVILFGVLVLSVRNRKMASKSQRSVYASPLLGAYRPAPKSQSRQNFRNSSTTIQHSGLLMGPGFEHTPRTRANTKAPGSYANLLDSPLEFPALQTSDEVKMSSASIPFETLDAIALAQKSALALPETGSAIQVYKPNSPAANEPIKFADRSLAGTPGAVEGSGATDDVEVKAEAPAAAATHEKSAPKNLLSFYGLQQQPFDVTPDPAYLYSSPTHRDALNSLKQGIDNFRGFMLLVAEPGMGKTTVLHKLMEELTDSARVVFLFQTQCSSRELLCFILNELEVDHTGMDVVAMHRALNQALLEEMLRGRRFVLIVDEAQNLQEPVLETIRLLSDFETTHSKLIQIVLAGQPQIAETLMRPSLVQLRQRISVLASLKSLTPDETAAYIEHRLRAAGWSDKLLFSSDALDQIAESSGGVPRSINNLCFNALLEGFQRGLEFIDADIVKHVAGRLDLESLVRRPEPVAAPQPPATPAAAIGASELARALAAALTAEATPDKNSANFIGPKEKPGVVLTGNLTEKVKSQGWSKNHEYRILVSLERDPFSGLPVAERYYCCSIYVDESQAAGLKPGKPVRIKIEQD
jgi:general secretion pathway protein A